MFLVDSSALNSHLEFIIPLQFEGISPWLSRMAGNVTTERHFQARLGFSFSPHLEFFIYYLFVYLFIIYFMCPHYLNILEVS